MDTRAERRAAAADPAARGAQPDKYHQAAIFYFGYGVFYLTRVTAIGIDSGWNMHGYPRWLAWILIPLGGLITIAFPLLIWRGVRWFTIALAIVVFIRAAYLFGQSNTQFFLGPFLVTAATAWMLARAAWDL